MSYQRKKWAVQPSVSRNEAQALWIVASDRMHHGRVKSALQERIWEHPEMVLAFAERTDPQARSLQALPQFRAVLKKACAYINDPGAQHV